MAFKPNKPKKEKTEESKDETEEEEGEIDDEPEEEEVKNPKPKSSAKAAKAAETKTEIIVVNELPAQPIKYFKDETTKEEIEYITRDEALKEILETLRELKGAD